MGKVPAFYKKPQPATLPHISLTLNKIISSVRQCSSYSCCQACCEPNNTILIVSVNKLFSFYVFSAYSYPFTLYCIKTNKNPQKHKKQNLHPTPSPRLELLCTASATYPDTGCNGNAAQMSTEKHQKQLEMRNRFGC